MKNHTAYISIGSNLEDKLFNCQKGITALTSSGISVLKQQSRFYKTEPVDYTEQNWFVNAVIKVETSLDPFQLFDKMKLIEESIGRVPDPIRFGPRVLDLDILLFNDMVIDTPNLSIPHPRMHNRRFVLQPFCDIDAKVVHPVLKKNMRQLLNRLDEEGQEVVYL